MASRSVHTHALDQGIAGRIGGGTATPVPEVSTFEAVYRTEWSRLVRLAFLMTGSLVAAEDVVQDAFVGLHKAWPTVDNPPAYLSRSVVNGVRMRFRRRSVVERHPPDRHRPVGNPEIDETWNLLAALPSRQRSALVLRYYEDLPIREVASLLDCSVGTAKSLIHRGLHRLEEMLR